MGFVGGFHLRYSAFSNLTENESPEYLNAYEKFKNFEQTQRQFMESFFEFPRYKNAIPIYPMTLIRNCQHNTCFFNQQEIFKSTIHRCSEFDELWVVCSKTEKSFGKLIR